MPDQVETYSSSRGTGRGLRPAFILEARVGFDLGVVLGAAVVGAAVGAGADVVVVLELEAAFSRSSSSSSMILPLDKNPPIVLRCFSSASLDFFFSFSSSALTPGTIFFQFIKCKK